MSFARPALTVAITLSLAATGGCALDDKPDDIALGDVDDVGDVGDVSVTEHADDTTNGDTSSGAPTATYPLRGTKNYYADDGTRRVKVKVALQAKVVDDFTTHFRPYWQITCWSHGERHRCSVETRTTTMCHRGNCPSTGTIGTSDSGSDGQYTFKGNWRSVEQCHGGYLATLLSDADSIGLRVTVDGKTLNVRDAGGGPMALSTPCDL